MRSGHHLKKQMLNLAEVVGTCISDIEDSWGALNHKIYLSLNSSLVEADTVRIEQIVVNLIENSLKYTPTGGEVFVTIESGGTDALLIVSDTGVGMSPELLEKVFEPFCSRRTAN